MMIRTVAVLAGVLVLAGSASAQGLGSRRGRIPGGTLSARPGVGGVGVPGDVPGGMLSTQPGVGGVGVPGDVPGGTLSTQPGVGGVGVPGQLPGGTLGTGQVCGVAGSAPVLVVPGLVVPVPGSFPATGDANAPGEGAIPSAPEE